MSKATDVRYGRRSGRWAEGTADQLLDDLHRTRLRAIVAGEWPAESLAIWLRLAGQAAEHEAAGRPIDDTLARALDVADAVRRQRKAAA